MKLALTLGALCVALCASAQTAAPPTAVVTSAAPAQDEYPSGTIKVGYTNVQYLLSASPQTKAIKSQLESASKQYERVIQEKMADLESKFAGYQKNEATMMESIKQDKQNELRNLESSIRTLQESASTELKAKESELVKPELDKIYLAIEDVSKAGAYTLVINNDQVLYAAKGTDVTSLVLKKLGYPEPKEEDARSESKTSTTPAEKPAKPAGQSKPGAAPSPSGKKK